MTFDDLSKEEQQSMLSEHADMLGITDTAKLIEIIDCLMSMSRYGISPEERNFLTSQEKPADLAEKYLNTYRKWHLEWASRGASGRTMYLRAYLAELNAYPEQERNAEIIAGLDKKYRLTIGRLPGREAFLRETEELYTVHSWCRVNKIFLEKYGMNLDEMLDYYDPYTNSMNNDSFHSALRAMLNRARETRLRNIKIPAVLDGITEIENYSRLDEILMDDEAEDYFCNFDQAVKDTFFKLFLKVKSRRWGTGRRASTGDSQKKEQG